MENDKIDFFKKISNEDDNQILRLPDYLENFVKNNNISELFRPLFSRYLLFRFHRFQLAKDAPAYPFYRLDEMKIRIPIMDDQNFNDLIGTCSALNLIIFEKDWYNINNGIVKDFESFLKIQNIYSYNSTKLKQSFWTKLFNWPKVIKTDFSINTFNIFDLLKGSLFLPSVTNNSNKKLIQFDSNFWGMSILDEFCFLIQSNSILLQTESKNKRKIISSKSYLNSQACRKIAIKLIGDDMSGIITRHGGIPSHVFTDEVFMSNACNKIFAHKFNKKKFKTRYGQIKIQPASNALIGLYDQSPYTCRFRTGMTRWQFLNEYIPDQKLFFELSKVGGYDKKIFFREPGRTPTPFLNTFSQVNSDTNNNIRQSLSEYGLLVITYDSSLPLFLIENEIPFFLFWRKEHWPFWSDEIYDFLRESGLYHEAPETLNENLIDYFLYGHDYWVKKYNQAANEYKKFLRSIYIDD